MRFSLRDGALVLVLVAGVVLALATQTGDRTGAPVSDAIDETTGALGPTVTGTRRVAQELPLTDEERARIHARIIRMPDAPTADVPAPELLEALPSFVPLQDLPAAVVQEIPLLQGYKFVKLDDRILLVSPATRIVVSEIPRYKLMLQ
jgi:hypothetical protein